MYLMTNQSVYSKTKLDKSSKSTVERKTKLSRLKNLLINLFNFNCKEVHLPFLEASFCLHK